MLGKRPDQRGLFEADTQYLEAVGKETFYGFLAGLRGQLFRDEDFAALYHEKTGRPSVPPSLLATALLLQTHDRVSDEEATERAAFDLRWKVALGIGIEDHPFAKSTLQLFRAQLVVHDEARTLFRRSLHLAHKQGYVSRNRKLRLALDTTNILGRGAVKDTYNLLADGIVLVLRQLADLAGMAPKDWALANGYGRYTGKTSPKGGARINWDSEKERSRFLRTIVADADRLLATVRETRTKLVPASAEDSALAAAAERLGQVLAQDIERREEGAALRAGVAKDRMPSIHDPEMRHGHKSAQKRFDGHKAQVAVDVESQLVTAVALLPGNAPDAEGALSLVEEAECNGGADVGETVGDCAFGAGATRQAFADAGRPLVAKVPAVHNGDCFPKTAFVIDLEATTCTCPAGETGEARYARNKALRRFQFAAAVCGACPLRSQCVRGRGGRSIQVHPQEDLLQQARALQESEDFHQYKVDRQVAEHRLARLVQLGIRQARYVGRTKTLFQLLLAATVANLTLLAAFGQATGGGAGRSSAAIAVLLALGIALLASWSRVLGHDWRQRLSAAHAPSHRRSPAHPLLAFSSTA